MSGNKPTVQDLDSCLRSVVTNWASFALHLPGVNQTELDIIEENKPGNVVGKKLELYKVWLRVHPNASWDDVVKALVMVGENAIAKQLKEKFSTKEELQEELMVTSKGVANMPSTKLSSIVRRHYSDLSNTIARSPDLLLSISNRFYQYSLIDLPMKVEINRSSGLTGASMLLDLVMMKTEQSDHYLPLVIDILREEVALADIVLKIEDSTATSQAGSTSLPDTTVILSSDSPHDPIPSPDTTVADTISAAERLNDAFESLCFLALMIINRTVINLALLKLKICLRLQYTRDNTPPEVQEHLTDLEQYSSSESIIMFLINKNFLGYLNFDLLEAFKPALSSDEFDEKLKKYQLAHEQFIKNNFQNIIEVFNRKPRLRPASIVGLPEIKVELATPWKSKSLYYWKELVNDIVDWGPYIVITRVEFNCISITYQVLPFIIPRVVKDLTNESIVKWFTAIGATFTIPDELLQDGIADNQWIVDVVQEQIVLKKTARRNNEKEDDPVINEANETTDQPLEGISPKPHLKLPKPITGGYEDELFMSLSFLSLPPDDLQCPVCYLTLREPHQLLCCGATLCQVCLDKSCASRMCPCCRDTDHMIVADKNARRRVMSLSVTCTVPGCYWSGELLDLEKHFTMKDKCPQPKTSNNTSIVPGVWQRHQEPSSLNYGTLPVYRTVKGFQNNGVLWTNPFYYFYTSDGGYRATLAVYPNGHGFGKGTHVSVYIHLMRGPNDDILEFPITGIFTARILGWRGSNHYIEKTILCDDSAPIKDREQVTSREIATFGWGYGRFLSHADLTNYLYEDMMCFKIGYYPIKQTGCSPVPNWCDVMFSTSATPPCTRTFYGYSVYKKTNSQWHSQPFYSNDEQYKLQLRVDANGSRSGKGTHLSLYVHLMKGEYDDTLSWPLEATITVQLLNWPSDNHHEEKAIVHYNAPVEYRWRVINGIRAPVGRGYDQFISHFNLESSARFINDDSICFRVINVEIFNDI